MLQGATTRACYIYTSVIFPSPSAMIRTAAVGKSLQGKPRKSGEPSILKRYSLLNQSWGEFEKDPTVLLLAFVDITVVETGVVVWQGIVGYGRAL